MNRAQTGFRSEHEAWSLNGFGVSVALFCLNFDIFRKNENRLLNRMSFAEQDVMNLIRIPQTVSFHSWCV